MDLERVEPERHAPGLWRAIGRDPAPWTHIPPGNFDEQGRQIRALGDLG